MMLRGTGAGRLEGRGDRPRGSASLWVLGFFLAAVLLSGGCDALQDPQIRCYKVCRDKGCGEAEGCVCGACPDGHFCSEFQCVPDCATACQGKVCGTFSNCACGECPKGLKCTVHGSACVCEPSCDKRECGEDGCGGSCGTCKPQKELCVEGRCVCAPDCAGKECGDDGCGGSCGKCIRIQHVCEKSVCVCKPDCTNRQCGSDGCKGTCGRCTGNQEECKGGKCLCRPSCLGRKCGGDGCGGGCGNCPGWQNCDEGICYDRVMLGVALGSQFDPQQLEPMTLANFVYTSGVTPAASATTLGFPADWSGSCEFDKFPTQWAAEVVKINPRAAIVVTLMPQCGLDLFVTDFEPGNKAFDATRELAVQAEQFAGSGPVFFRFAHQMNGHWFPWAVCRWSNPSCLKDPGVYRTAFANFARVVHTYAPTKGLTVWNPFEHQDYWSGGMPYPTYDDFYPGDESVDWVALDLSYQKAQGDKKIPHFRKRIKDFYDRFASPQGRGKPMMIGETSAECKVVMENLCLHPFGNFNGPGGWWPPWGDGEDGDTLTLSAAPRSPPGLCDGVGLGASHLVLSASSCENGYVGGTGYNINWEKGRDLSDADMMLFWAKKGGEGESPVLRIEFCDMEFHDCPADQACCEADSVYADTEISWTDWKAVAIPYAEFAPTKKDANPAKIAWKRIRAVKLHLMCAQPGQKLATLHLDGMGGGYHGQKNYKQCENLSRTWLSEVFTPGMCIDFPNLRMINLTHVKRLKRERQSDFRIQDWGTFSTLMQDECMAFHF